MRGNPIADTDHVVRHCRPSYVDNGRVSGEAFKPRLIDGKPEEYVSVLWLEHAHPTDLATQLEIVRAELAAIRSVKASHKLAMLNVGSTKSQVEKQSLDQRVLGFHHEPINPKCPSHSGIYDCRLDDDLIADLIATTVISIVPAT